MNKYLAVNNADGNEFSVEANNARDAAVAALWALGWYISGPSDGDTEATTLAQSPEKRSNL